MTLIEKNRNFLKFLTCCKKKLRKILIKNASKDEIYSICEIVLNVLNGNLKLSKKDLEKFSKKRKLLRELVQRGPVIKKKYLIQKGGFLQILIPSIISGLASIVTSLIDKE